jgi:hypothetical protein
MGRLKIKRSGNQSSESFVHVMKHPETGKLEGEVRVWAENREHMDDLLVAFRTTLDWMLELRHSARPIPGYESQSPLEA